MPYAVIFIGPPGSGKDTQANLLVDEYGFTAIPSSQIIRAKFAENPDDPIIQEQKKLYDSGKLNSSEFVASLIIEFVRPLVVAGKSIIFSGSPRVVDEAEGEIHQLSDWYGVGNLIVIHFDLDEVEARRRASTRRLCRAQNHPFPNTPELEWMKTCPKDGSEIYVRELDNPEKYTIRLSEYRKLTEPCLEVFKKAGIAIHIIDASRTIEAIHHDIANLLERNKEPVL